LGWGERDDLSIARTSYFEELAASGSGPVRDDTGATVRGIVQDLGVERSTLRQWLTRYGTRRKTGTYGRPEPRPADAGPATPGRAGRRRQGIVSDAIARPVTKNAEL